MDKIARRNRRKKTIRKKVFGSAEKPRMCISRSNKNIMVQIINDVEGKTICSLSTMSKVFTDSVKNKSYNNIESAKALGAVIAKDAKPKGVSKVVFDRSGYPYHGVVKALADGARENGLEF